MDADTKMQIVADITERAQASILARHPRILDHFGQDVSRAGVVGEDRLAKQLYLALTSRLLDDPVSIAVKGPSAGGKSYTIDQVLSFFPSSAYYVLSSMSERALAYSDEPLSHRHLVIYEAAGMASDLTSYLIRSLLSEGRIRYETVEKTKEGMKARLIDRPGPTGLIVTTTAVKLHPENETRLFSVTVNDTPDQTRRIFADLAGGRIDQVNRRPWLDLQGFLERGEHRVVIPWARVLAELVPPVAVRLRRDFGALLSLIRAHAVLQQETRERTSDGSIVASIEDYEIVRDLVADLVSEGVAATVAPTVRETVETVARLATTEHNGVSVSAVAHELGLDKSAASRRVRSAIHANYLVNEEERRGHPSRLVLGEPLPDDVEILPSVERLQDRCTVAGVSEGVKTIPVYPLDPERNTATPLGEGVER
jgi:hypothetical protein